MADPKTRSLTTLDVQEDTVMKLTKNCIAAPPQGKPIMVDGWGDMDNDNELEEDMEK